MGDNKLHYDIGSIYITVGQMENFFFALVIAESSISIFLGVIRGGRLSRSVFFQKLLTNENLIFFFGSIRYFFIWLEREFLCDYNTKKSIPKNHQLTKKFNV